MTDKGFILIMAVVAAGGSLLAFLNPKGIGVPVRVWPFGTRQRSIRFTAWGMLLVAIVLMIIWWFL